MRKQFQELNDLKPSLLAKEKLMVKLEENEMKKQCNNKKIGKLAIGLLLAIGCLSIPFVQNSMETSITTKAKQIEVLNKQMEEVNAQYKNYELTYEEYMNIVTPLENEMDKAITEAKEIDPDFKVKVVKAESTVNENGEEIHSYEIIDDK